VTPERLADELAAALQHALEDCVVDGPCPGCDAAYDVARRYRALTAGETAK